VLRDNEKKPARDLEIGVTGQQFAWTFQYPPSVTGGKPVESDQLVAARERVRALRPALQGRDPRLLDPCLPPAGGRRAGDHRPYRATPDRLGTYPIVCNLLCGVGHSLMRAQVHVVTEAKFKEFLKRRAAASGASASTTVGSGGGSTSSTTGTAAGIMSAMSVCSKPSRDARETA